MTNLEPKTATQIEAEEITECIIACDDLENREQALEEFIAQAIEEAEKRGVDSQWAVKVERDALAAVLLEVQQECITVHKELNAARAEASVLAIVLQNIASDYANPNDCHSERQIAKDTLANLSPATQAAMGVIEATVNYCNGDDEEYITDVRSTVAKYERVMGGGE